MLIVLTDSEFKASQGWLLLKEIQKEVYSDSNGDAIDGDLENAKSMNHCREGIISIMSNFLTGGAGLQKVDKVNKA